MVTKGKYYLRRTDDGIALPMFDADGNPSGEHLTCHVCRPDYERPDMVGCETHDPYICSLDLCPDNVGDHVLPASDPSGVDGLTGRSIPPRRVGGRMLWECCDH
jgi:hypothetical protein